MKRDRRCDDGGIEIEKEEVEKQHQQQPRKLKVESEEDETMMTEEKLNLCLLFNSTANFTYRWHLIDPLFQTTENPNSTPKTPCSSATQLFEMLRSDFPAGMFTTVVSDSKIFLVGGCQMPNLLGVPSSEVRFIDTSRFPNAPLQLEEAPLMIFGKLWCLAVAVNGKIYALGTSDNPLDAKPWAEVFDIATNSWSDLPFPPDHVLHHHNHFKANYVYHEKANRIITSYPSRNPGDLLYFDITTNLWGFIPGMNDLRSKFRLIHGRPVIVDDDLYLICDHNKLFVASLVAPVKQMVQIHGLEEATQTLKPTEYNDFNDVDSFLSHLGNGLLCLVWSVHERRNVAYVHCVKFHVNSTSGQQPYAVIDRCDSYLVDDVGTLTDCLPIVMRSTTTTPGSDDPNVHHHPQTILPCADSSSRRTTRHARRVLVDGFPPNTDAQTIERFFTYQIVSKLTHSDLSPTVLDVYINNQKKFAIVELNSEEQAKVALHLDDPRLDGHSLIIRRPGDYNPVRGDRMFPYYDREEVGDRRGLSWEGAEVRDRRGLSWEGAEDNDRQCLSLEGAEYAANPLMLTMEA